MKVRQLKELINQLETVFQAAQYAISRRKLAEELCGEAKAYPDPDPLANEEKLDFYGQR